MRSTLFAAAIAAAIPGGAIAENDRIAFPFDPDRLFGDNAARIERRPDGTEVLAMPGGVIVTRKGDTVLENDPSGAVGCSLVLWINMRIIVDACVGLSPSEAAMADARIERQMRFAAENSWPPIAVEDLRAAFARHAWPVTEKQCDQARNEGWLKSELEMLRDPAGDAKLDRLLATPRLPVMNPCL